MNVNSLKQTYAQQAQAIVRKFDANQNGAIDRDELVGPKVGTVTQRIGTYGKSTRDAFAGVNRDSFERADANRDNKLTADEMVTDMLKDADPNGDGKSGFIEHFVRKFRVKHPADYDMSARFEREVLSPTGTYTERIGLSGSRSYQATFDENGFPTKK